MATKKTEHAGAKHGSEIRWRNQKRDGAEQLERLTKASVPTERPPRIVKAIWHPEPRFWQAARGKFSPVSPLSRKDILVPGVGLEGKEATENEQVTDSEVSEKS